MSYVCQLSSSIDEVDPEEWREVCRSSENLYLDPRFLKAVELSFADQARFWFAIVRDETGRAVAATCFFRYLVDSLLMAPAPLQRFAAGVRRVWPRFFKFHMLLCGLPISVCEHQLAIVEDADIAAVLEALDRTSLALARETGCRLISFKDFPPELAARTEGLIERGFLRTRSLFTYQLRSSFGSFAEYLAARPKRARLDMRSSLRRFAEEGLTCEQIRGRDGAERLLTPEVYQLYLNVLQRAKVRFECIPLRFFQELARQLPDDSCFTFLRDRGRIVAFGCGFSGLDQHSLLFLGRDYDVTPNADLYFNTIYSMLEQAIRPGTGRIHFGAAADEFKQRLGCDGWWLSAYVKGSDPIGQAILKRVFPLLFDTCDDLDGPPPVGSLRVSREVAFPEAARIPPRAKSA